MKKIIFSLKKFLFSKTKSSQKNFEKLMMPIDPPNPRTQGGNSGFGILRFFGILGFFGIFRDF
jgi:hypothetical protein